MNHKEYVQIMAEIINEIVDGTSNQSEKIEIEIEKIIVATKEAVKKALINHYYGFIENQDIFLVVDNAEIVHK